MYMAGTNQYSTLGYTEDILFQHWSGRVKRMKTDYNTANCPFDNQYAITKENITVLKFIILVSHRNGKVKWSNEWAHKLNLFIPRHKCSLLHKHVQNEFSSLFHCETGYFPIKQRYIDRYLSLGS